MWRQTRLTWIVFFLSAISTALFLTTGSAYSQENVKVSLNVNDTVFVTEGYTSPTAFVSIMRDGQLIGTTSANQNGYFYKKFSAQSPGVHNFKIYARNAQQQLTDTISQNINISNQTTTKAFFFLPPTLSLSSDNLQATQQLIVTGTTYPGSKVLLHIDNNTTLSTKASSGGSWSYEVDTTDFYTGTHSLFVVSQTDDGTQSAPSAKRLFQVRSSPPVQEVSDGSVHITPPSITFPTNNYLAEGDQITVEGIAAPNIQIELWEGTQLLGSSFSNGNGNWKIKLSLDKASYQLKARACLQGACSVFSGTVTLLHRVSEGGFDLELNEYRFFDIYAGDAIDIKALWRNGEAPYEIAVDWGDDTVERFNTNESDYSLSHSFDSPGHYTGIITVKDNADATETRYFSVLVSDRSERSGTRNLSGPGAAIAATGTLGFTLLVARLLRKGGA